MRELILRAGETPISAQTHDHNKRAIAGVCAKYPNGAFTGRSTSRNRLTPAQAYASGQAPWSRSSATSVP